MSGRLLVAPGRSEEWSPVPTDLEGQARTSNRLRRLAGSAASAAVGLALVSLAGGIGVWALGGRGTQARDVAAGAVSLASPCQCEIMNPEWTKCTRKTPKCIFIDLGAADGNTFKMFLNNSYGEVANCPSDGAWEAHLVEANPMFNEPLQDLAKKYPDEVHALSSTAVYACPGTTSFFIDTVNTDHNYWGSSMSADNPTAQKSGHQNVTVPMINLIRLVYEQTIPADYVIVKMDVEGMEWDILPCMAQTPITENIDRLLMEVHWFGSGMNGTSQDVFALAKAVLQGHGTDIPEYYSPTK